MLTAEERQAVLGDMVESGQTGAQALRDLLGLLMRQQPTFWTDWRPWAALLGLVVPAALALSFVARMAAGMSAIYAWFYVNNWTAGYLAPGFRQDLIRYAGMFGISYVALICWAWTCGLLLGSLSRRATAVNGSLFFLVLAAQQFLAALHTPDPADVNAPVFALAFYRVGLPLIVLALFVFVPAQKGMRRAQTFDKFSGMLRAIVYVCAIITVLSLVGQRFPHLLPFLHLVPGQFRTFAIAPMGPLAYLTAIALSRHQQNVLRRATHLAG
jgi:hypothetical protein